MAMFLSQNKSAFNVSNLDTLDVIHFHKDYFGGEKVTVVALGKGQSAAAFISKNELTIEQILKIIKLANSMKTFSVEWDTMEELVLSDNS